MFAMVVRSGTRVGKEADKQAMEKHNQFASLSQDELSVKRGIGKTPPFELENQSARTCV
jgi:hypothetical protein